MKKATTPLVVVMFSGFMVLDPPTKTNGIRPCFHVNIKKTLVNGNYKFGMDPLGRKLKLLCL